MTTARSEISQAADGRVALHRAGSATQWASIGDTVETTLSDGRTMRVEIVNSPQCACANDLIATGRWKVSPNH